MPDSDERLGVILRTLRDEVTMLKDEKGRAHDGGRWDLLSRRIQALENAVKALDPLVGGVR